MVAQLKAGGLPHLTVAANAVRALLDFGVAKGAQRQALLERSGINPAALADPDNRIAFCKYVALTRVGQDLCDDPAFALRFGEEVDLAEVAIGCAMGGFTTIDEAFAQVNRYARLTIEVEGVGAGDRFIVSRRAGQLWIVDSRRNPNEFPELTETTFARMVCSTRRSLGDVPFFKELRVTHGEPEYSAEYQRIFRIPVAFHCEENALRVDERIVSAQPPLASSRYVSQILRDRADALLRLLDESVTTRARVERALVRLMSRGDVRIETICKELGLSRHTLFRRLRVEGVTFEGVLDELRYRLALHHLGAPNASVHRVARLVAYSDTTAFSRAFKRWTGQNPREHFARRPP